ncbi:MAG: enoyl-CoA hydratase/isomerase family protein [Deltaproteobacteria bacterium]|nr:enoyl-CoA hydratase/isomerase family protein [Deltaproteobacteria bacterium]
MRQKTITVEYKDRICIVTLNRPQERNAMDREMIEDFEEAINKIQKDQKAKVLVLTGAGRAFCAGADLKMLPRWIQATPAVIEKGLLEFYRGFLRVTELPIPTVAAINGPAIGAGGCLALACDMRIAAQEATIGFTFIKLGINSGMGSEFFLSKLVGPARTLELLMTGDILTADEALRIGLVNKVVSSRELMDLVMKFAGKLAAMPALPIKIIKESTYAASRSTLADVLHKEAAYQSICFQSENVKEGIKAIRERRKPRFQEE